nr:gastric triacylglycerol lipase-like [Procambarus clarkii]
MTGRSPHLLLVLAAAAATATTGPESSTGPGSLHHTEEHPHTRLTTPELMKVRGYTAETHHLITEDGYILEMHRIPYGRIADAAALHATLNPFTSFRDPFLYPHAFPNISQNTLHPLGDVVKRATLHSPGAASRTSGGGRNKRNKPRRVAFLLHGVFSSSADFVMNDPDQALGFILADEGYDVWIGNTRGNFYGRRHVTLSPDQPEFWDYSWNEIARYDVPAMLSYVRKATGAPQVYYVGHSLGAAIFFATLDYHPHINSWVRVMAALAPAAYITGRPVPMSVVSPFANLIDDQLSRTRHLELLPLTPKRVDTSSSVCADGAVANFLCVFIYFTVAGGSNGFYLDREYMPVIFSHWPAGTGLHIVTQLLQVHHSGRFHAFDYGPERNLLEYGSPSPPDYSLSSVNVPVGIFWSENDFVVDPQGVRLTAAKLPNLVLDHRVSVRNFNHNDFLLAENAADVVYRHVVQLLQDYSD